MNKRRVWALVLSIVMVLSVFAYVPVQNVEAAGVSVQYKSHVQTFGWESAWKRDGEASGTSGKAKRLEGIRITVSGDNLGVRYTTHCQTYGWLPWVSNGEMSGTQGEAKRLEAIKIELTGANAQNYDIYYRVHAQSSHMAGLPGQKMDRQPEQQGLLSGWRQFRLLLSQGEQRFRIMSMVS